PPFPPLSKGGMGGFVKPESAYESEEIKGMSVIVERASGKKCERCWNWSTSVGTYSDATELCHRCYNVIR
ncbi:MAG: zinc finger domain-containing protein, partial [Nitrospirota bacterium]|nr:zinc finger domain-containing protein [Nitrospirota bacterium]